MHNFIRCLFSAWLLAVLLFATASSPRLRAADDAAGLNWNPSEVAERSKDIIEALMEHHIEPPTRQQLVLEVLRAVAEVTHQRLPLDLSLRISKLGDADALYALLNDEVVRLGLNGQSSEWMNDAVLKRLNHVVPGGVRIVSQRQYAVDEQLAANRYVGIGVQAGMDSGSQRMNFMGIVEGGPAEAAGLLADDIVESVDGKDTQKVSVDEVIQWIRGPEDSVVRLTVRSPGAESRDVEVVRRVVPLKTLNLVPQNENSAAALIRFGRVSASSVHELRKIIGELPESVTTVILDLRYTQDGSLHHLNLLADALLEECELGNVETRSGVRPLVAEAGTIFGVLRPVMLYNPGHSAQLDWLAAVSEQNGVRVFRDEFKFWETQDEIEVVNQSIREFVPLQGGAHYIGITTSRLLTSGEGSYGGENPAGILFGSATSAGAEIGTLEWFIKQLGAKEDDATLFRPRAIQVLRDFQLTTESLPAQFQQRKPPATDKLLIEQIMADK